MNDFQQHPIDRSRYTILTPPIMQLCDRVLEWVDLRAPGGIVTGRQRLGKTEATRYMQAVLEAKYPGIPRVVLLCKKRQRVSDRGFFEQLLNALGHEMISKGSVEEKEARVVRRLLQLCSQKNADRLILIADDAQYLDESEYDWLMMIQNELNHRCVDMTTIFVGQAELALQREILSKTGKRHILGRFMAFGHEFSGLKSIQDVEETLRSYDELTEYPAGSGISFTQYYFRSAWDEGWRLTSLGKQFWEAFGAARAKAKKGPLLELPMQYFVRAVNFVFKRHGRNTSPVVEISELAVYEAVERSGYCHALACGDFE